MQSSPLPSYYAFVIKLATASHCIGQTRIPNASRYPTEIDVWRILVKIQLQDKMIDVIREHD